MGNKSGAPLLRDRFRAGAIHPNRGAHRKESLRLVKQCQDMRAQGAALVLDEIAGEGCQVSAVGVIGDVALLEIVLSRSKRLEFKTPRIMVGI